MILTDLLGAEVHALLGDGSDEGRIGWVTDIRLLLDEPGAADQAMPRARLRGLIVSPRTRASSLGFERLDMSSPWPIARFEHWLHRGSFLVLWPDVAGIADRRIRLRAGFTHYSAALVSSAVAPPS